MLLEASRQVAAWPTWLAATPKRSALITLLTR